MKTINYINRIVICMILVIMFNTCYAATVKIPCARSEAEAQWYTVRSPGPNARFSVKMLGTQIEGREGLVTDWLKYVVESHDIVADPAVAAICSVSRKGTGMLNPDGTVVTCDPGEAIQFKMDYPNDPNPKKYVAVLELTREIVDTQQ